MCGIAGVAGKDSEALVKKMLEAIKHRGPDGSGTYSLGNITLGNVLLKITGSGSQPISKNFMKGLSKTVAPLYFADTYAHRHTWIPHKARCRFSNDGYGAPYPDTPSRGVTREGYAKHTPTLRKPKFRLSNGGALTYNGEIYNFMEIAEKLHINTDSDSEALFALIGSKGIESAILELDGDYAFAYAKDGKLHLARDPAGVKPLYYGKGACFAFASEKKALSAIGIKDIHALKPGHMLSYSAGEIAEKKVACFATGERITDENIASKMLYNAIERAVKKRCYMPCAVAFSGGLDSSLIAALCPEAELYSVGMKGSHDIVQTKKAAKLLGLSDKLHVHELTIDEVEPAIHEVIWALESRDPLKVSIALPLFLASKNAHNDGIRVMLSGQGADELFAGYKRYESLNPDELEFMLRKDLDNIAENNLERDDAVTMANAVELRVPYLDKGVVELALRIAPELKIRNGMRKYILRLAANALLPQELVFKEKKAAQYSSGIYSALEKIARKNGYKGERALGRHLEERKAGI